MDPATLAQILERLTNQIGQLETRIQDQATAYDRRLAEIEASIHNEEESVDGGPRMQPRRNVRIQNIHHNNE